MLDQIRLKHRNNELEKELRDLNARKGDEVAIEIYWKDPTRDIIKLAKFLEAVLRTRGAEGSELTGLIDDAAEKEIIKPFLQRRLRFLYQEGNGWLESEEEQSFDPQDVRWFVEECKKCIKTLEPYEVFRQWGSSTVEDLEQKHSADLTRLRDEGKELTKELDDLRQKCSDLRGQIQSPKNENHQLTQANNQFVEKLTPYLERTSPDEITSNSGKGDYVDI